MLATKIKRTFKAGFVSFWRNGFVSLASVLVMTVTLGSIAAVMLVGAMLTSTLTSIEDKVDINVYFNKTASEQDILGVKKTLEALPQVATVTYLSRDKVLADFRSRHQDDASILQALDEIGDNPLLASFNIKAKDPSQYETIAKFLQDRVDNDRTDNPLVARINYTQNKQAIEALSRIIDASRNLGTIAIIFFVLVSLLITFNTIRLAIYIFREEIAVMRLVGASEMYIRGPFVTVGLMYGLVSGVVTLIVLWPVTYWLGPLTFNIGTNLNIFNYYFSHFFSFFFIILGAGLLLGAASSYLAVKKYLKV